MVLLFWINSKLLSVRSWGPGSDSGAIKELDEFESSEGINLRAAADTIRIATRAMMAIWVLFRRSIMISEDMDILAFS